MNIHVVETCFKFHFRITDLHIKVILIKAFERKQKEREECKLTLRKFQKLRMEMQCVKGNSSSL